MDTQTYDIWKRLTQYQIDIQDAGLSFTARLARDNRWSQKFAKRVIDEYKKFVLLAKVAGHPVTPSDQVDQAWHLHLIYSDEYWNTFCKHILEYDLHHYPTQGGTTEGLKFRDWYAKTLDSYERVFGHSPPADIWPGLDARFRGITGFVRFNVSDYVLVKKSHLRRFLQLGLTTAGVGLAAVAVAKPNSQESSNFGILLSFIIVCAVLIVIIKALAAHKNSKHDGGGGCGGGGVGGGHSSADSDGGSGCGSGCGGGCGGCGG